MNISKDYIVSVSINDAAVKNGADLVKKKQFSKLFIDHDHTFLSGECLGSGKTPYFCSADFINENAPVFRCTCPSRQIPCKHVIGLLWAFVEGAAFAEADIPEDIMLKRENKEKRATKTKEKLEHAEKSTDNKKSAAWKRAAVKKIDAQLIGIEEAKKIIQSIIQSGLGALDAKSVHTYEGIVKQLDSYFIIGIQNELNDLLGMAHYNNGDKDKKENADYARMMEKVCQIHTLLVRSGTYLEKKKEAPEIMDTESEIEELIGYAWKLEELAQYHLVETEARLIQLCFHVKQEVDKKQFIDEGFYISLDTGKIYKARNYRPFRAAKYIKEEDSIFPMLHIPKLYIYPSQSMNPRVRWDEYTVDSGEKIPPEVYKKIKSYANPNFNEVIKAVKNQLKNLLLFPHPAMLVQFTKISKINSESEVFALHDAFGNVICLQHSSYCHISFSFLLEKLTQAEAENNAMLLLFDNDIGTGVLSAQPLALITDNKIIRLLY